MSLSLKLVPLAALAALGFFALMPGGGAKPQPAYASDCGVDVGTLSVRIMDELGETLVEGFGVTISPDPLDDAHAGDLTIDDGGAGDDAAGDVGQIDVDGACQTDHTGFPDDVYTINLFINDTSEADSLGCVIIDDEVQIAMTTTSGATVEMEVECANGTPTPTVTGTPPTSTPTGTLTPAANTISVAAVPQTPPCGSPSFIFATVRNDQGVVLSGQTVTFTASGGVGTFNPASGLTVVDGVFSTTYTPPATGAQTITITATANGKSDTTTVTTNCAAAQATNTPVPAQPTSQVKPPSTGDAGLAEGNSSVVYGGLAMLIGLTFAGALVAARRRA